MTDEKGHFHSKVIHVGMLVVSLRYEILILVFLGFSGKFCTKMKFWYLLGSAHFLYQVKMKSFLKSFQ